MRKLHKVLGIIAIGALILAFGSCKDGGDDSGGGGNNGGGGGTPANATLKLTPVETNKFTLTITGATWKSDIAYFSKEKFVYTMSSGSSYALGSIDVVRTSDTVLTMTFKHSTSGWSSSSYSGTAVLQGRDYWEYEDAEEKGIEAAKFLYTYTNEGMTSDYGDSYKFVGTVTVAEDSGTVTINIPAQN